MPPKHDSEDELRRPEPFFGPGTPVRIGVACVVALAIGTGVIKLNTWATQVDSKLTGIQRDMDKMGNALSALEKLSVIETRFDAKIDELRKYGSDNAKDTAAELRKLREEFDMHKVTTTPSK